MQWVSKTVGEGKIISVSCVCSSCAALCLVSCCNCNWAILTLVLCLISLLFRSCICKYVSLKRGMEGVSHKKHKHTHKGRERGKGKGGFWRLIRRKNMISDKMSKLKQSDNKFYNIFSIWQNNQTVWTCLLSPTRIWIPLWGRLQHVWNLFLFQTWPPGFGHIYYLDLLCYPITFITLNCKRINIERDGSSSRPSIQLMTKFEVQPSFTTTCIPQEIKYKLAYTFGNYRQK